MCAYVLKSLFEFNLSYLYMYLGYYVDTYVLMKREITRVNPAVRQTRSWLLNKGIEGRLFFVHSTGVFSIFACIRSDKYT